MLIMVVAADLPVDSHFRKRRLQAHSSGGRAFPPLEVPRTLPAPPDQVRATMSVHVHCHSWTRREQANVCMFLRLQAQSSPPLPWPAAPTPSVCATGVEPLPRAVHLGPGKSLLCRGCEPRPINATQPIDATRTHLPSCPLIFTRRPYFRTRSRSQTYTTCTDSVGFQ